MTREEAIKAFEEIRENAQNNLGAKWAYGCDGYYRDKIELADVALAALRPVSRERIEKVWKGEWIKERRQTYIPVEYDEQGEVILHDFVVYRCSICGRENTKEEPFCNCGAPMTDAAVLTVMDRLEVLKDE